MSSVRASLLGLGISIAVGLVLSAAIVSYTANRIGNNKQSVSVKGLAEKAVSADQARWTITVNGVGASLPEAFAHLRANQPMLLTFLKQQGFKDQQISSSREAHQIVYKQDAVGRPTREIEQYIASQNVMLASNDVQAVDKAAGKIVQLTESGLPIQVNDPEFLVSTLEAVKMSLIANATRNAHDRATEFAKTGGAQVGAMKSATQGAFYILPAQGGGSNDDYGGAYDKSTIAKLARVVVTVEYAISQ
ncbi:SIMPL domain-containing protein [Deefgea piscis]|uniref:SIMPL domain-containing protein n=1 Tax=Deefgea piscis TaxID=2739061 RepID=UPI001C7E8E60|nr:SIMPL domain-containing protein [Deefgea piscis]QZA79829.1 SIMPL domain-containing protein [Deefgea piscis]